MRRLLLWKKDRLHLLDTVSSQMIELFSVYPDALDITFALSRDNRLLYFTRINRQADVWADSSYKRGACPAGVA